MFKKNKYFYLFLTVLLTNALSAQQTALFNQFFVNPYLYNPSYAGKGNITRVQFLHRRQWAGVEGAPVTSALSFQLPVNNKVSLGLNVISDKRGILATNSGLFTFGYTLQMGSEQSVRIGLSLGAESNIADAGNSNDPAVLNSNKTGVQANYGISYHLKSFHIGVALPRLLQSKAPSVNEFGNLKFSPTNNFIINTGYRFEFPGGKVAFEPNLIYRRNDNLFSQVEAVGTVHINNLFWFGGSYRQDYGPAAFIGIKVKERITFGYAYEIPSSSTTGPGSPTHELLLSIGFKRNRASVGETQKEDEAQKEEIAKVDKLESESNNENVKEENKVANAEPIIKNSNQYNAPTDYIRKNGREVNKPGKKEEIIKLKVKKHILEAEKGHYIVIGAFRMYDNVIRYQNQLKDQGVYCTVTYSSTSLYYYAYLYEPSLSVEDARQKRDETRRQARFEDAWLMIVE